MTYASTTSATSCFKPSKDHYKQAMKLLGTLYLKEVSNPLRITTNSLPITLEDVKKGVSNPLRITTNIRDKLKLILDVDSFKPSKDHYKRKEDQKTREGNKWFQTL